MTKISDIKAREIIDSRGNPTLECDIFFDNNSFGRSSVPSGASKGKHEALELRDGEKNRYNGKGVLKAVSNILDILKPNLLDKEFLNIEDFDNFIIKLEGSKNKSNLGANTTLALSLAFSRCLANHSKMQLFELLSVEDNFTLPVPMMNIINGGAHADNNIDIQEFMIMPVSAESFSETVRYGSEIFQSLKSNLKSLGYNTNVGDEGGFAPNLNSNHQAIDLILESILVTGLKPEKDIYLSMDFAANEFFKNGKYELSSENKIFTSDQMVDYVFELVKNYPIFSIEDALSEDDWDGWKILTQKLKNKVQIVGDDLFVTNIERLKKGINNNIANSILVKLNQIGTLSETLAIINTAKENNYSSVISHRSGETEDTFIADLAVATSAGQIKTGSLSRSDRTSKYNQLIRIEEMLGKKAKFSGKTILKD
tara:strand:- start:9 stop:1286 length:1278 start_codon:yes stop_codon:yes gene_type:complete